MEAASNADPNLIGGLEDELALLAAGRRVLEATLVGPALEAARERLNR